MSTKRIHHAAVLHIVLLLSLGSGTLAARFSQVAGEPIEAIQGLVDEVFGPDETAARAAVGELLRQAGLPLVSIDGPVVGLPGDLVLYDAAIYVELLPDLTRAVRRGDFYTAQELSELLADIGVTGEPLEAEVLVAGLGQWGKASGSPEASQVAGTTVRALSGRRLQVLYRGADLEEMEFDPLQVVLILAHATSRASTPVSGASSLPPAPLTFFERLMGVQAVALAASTEQGKGPCDDLEKALNPPGQVADAVTSAAKDAILDSWKEAALSEKAQQALRKGGAVFDKGSAVVNTMLLLMGASIEVHDDKNGVTHFKHAAGQRDRHVTVTAVARFDSSIAKKEVACYKLAGIDVPPPGRLAGFRIRWSMAQRRGRGHQGRFLAAVPADRVKLDSCGNCGQVTGSDGQSTLELYPPVEDPPGVGKELSGRVLVTARLDKDDFPFKLKDLLGLTNPAGFVATKAWDLAISALQRAGLPSSKLSIRVDYHGSDIFIAKGGAELFYWFTTAPAQLDIWTCEGVEGTWHAQDSGLGGDARTFFGEVAGKIIRRPIPENVQYLRDFEFRINPQAVENVFAIVPEGDTNGIMRLDEALLETAGARTLRDWRVGRPAGEVEIRLGPDPWPWMLTLKGSMVFPLYWVPEDDRCPGKEAKFENNP